MHRSGQCKKKINGGVIMNTQTKQNQEDCKDCYKIKCKNCGWEPDEKELANVLSGKLINCPDCGSLK
jgi:hypothetical protein